MNRFILKYKWFEVSIAEDRKWKNWIKEWGVWIGKNQKGFNKRIQYLSTF